MTPGATLDLHLHTNYSDGEHPVRDLLAQCARRGLTAVAVTDHDDVRAAAASTGPDLEVIAGVEISSSWRGQELHCLAYHYDAADRRFAARVSRYKQAVLDGWRSIFTRSHAHGGQLTWSDVQSRVGVDRVPYPRTLVDILVDGSDPHSPLGQFRGRPYDHVVAAWFAPGRPLHAVPPEPPDLRVVLRWVREAGGVPVLAHPLAQLDYCRLEEDLALLRSHGLGGLEAWSTWHRAESDAEALRRLCATHQLVATAGSDFHGVRIKDWVRHPGDVPGSPPPVATVLESLARARTQSG